MHNLIIMMETIFYMGNRVKTRRIQDSNVQEEYREPRVSYVSYKENVFPCWSTK